LTGRQYYADIIGLFNHCDEIVPWRAIEFGKNAK